jgi:hypothetical protein
MAILTASQLLTTVIDIPTAKDANQWYAGGMLRNETYPGGINFSPIRKPSLENTLLGNDVVSSMLNGNFMFLNAGMSAVSSFMNTGILDLLSEYKSRETAVIKVTIEVYENTSTGKEYSGEASFDIDGEIDYAENSFSLSSVSKITKNSYSLTSLIGGSPLTIATKLYNVYTDEEITLEETIASGILGSVKQAASNVVSKSIIGIVGTTNMIAMGAIALAVSAVVSEFFEYALGTDISIGYGGEYSDKYSKQFRQDSFSASKGILGLGSLFDSLSYSVGISDSLTTEYTNALGISTGNVFESADLSVATSYDDGSFTLTENEDFGLVDDILDNLDDDSTITTVSYDEETGELSITVSEDSGDGQASDGFTGLDQETQDDVNDSEFGIGAQSSF